MPDIFGELAATWDRDTHAVAERMRELAHPHRHGAQPAAQVTHLSPSPTSGIMPCCGETPLDVPRTDRITTDRELVTCHGAPAPDADAATQTPATQPVNLAAAPAAAEPLPKENPVQISNIAGDIKGAIENADEWVKQVTETHLPSLLAQAQRYESSPIVQSLEKALLPPEVEAGVAALIDGLAVKYPAAAAAAPDAPAAPVPA